MKNKNILFIAAVILLLGAGIYAFRDRLVPLFFAPGTSSVETGVSQQEIVPAERSTTAADDQDQASQIEVVAKNLEIPWEIVFLPDETLLVTQRPGALLRIYPDREESIQVEGVQHVGEGGLLGMVLHPDFERNNRLYLYLTTQANGGLINRVESYRFDLENNQLLDRQLVIDELPGARIHDGGRMAFGPDNLLYITVGDAAQPDSAQDIDSLAGKILRLNPDGSIPNTNPFGNQVYSYGHRNPQGLAWDERGRLWATEHGPSARDEINLIEAGSNYGWPVIRGDETQEDMVSPVIHSGSDNTWAPAGLEIINQTLLFAGLRGSALFQAEITDNALIDLKRNFPNDYGRLRVVKFDGRDWIYLATSNTDGRGTVRENDDKIIRIRTSVLGL